MYRPGEFMWDRTLASRWKPLLAYGSGDAGFNLFWVLTDSFLLYFFVEVRHMQAWLLTPILFSGRMVDLVAGLVFGFWEDRTKSRFGTYRPFLLLGTLPMWVAFVIVFSASVGQRNTTLAVSYAVFALLYSAANVAYTALLSVITRSEAQRTRLSAARFVAAAGAVLVVQYCTLTLVTLFGRGDSAQGWQRVAILYGGCGALLILVCFAGLREVAPPARQSAVSPFESLRVVLLSSGFLRLLLAMTASLAALCCRGAITPFYVRYCARHPEWISDALVANSLAALLACGIMLMPAAKVFGARRLATWSAFGGMLFCLPALLSPHGSRAGLIAEQMLFGAATGVLVPCLFSLFSEYPSLLLAQGRGKTAGVVASASMTGLKLGATLGSAIVSVGLGWMRFVAAPVEPARITSGIGALFTILPAILFALTWWAVPASEKEKSADA